MKRCGATNCEERAEWGPLGGAATRCERHREAHTVKWPRARCWECGAARERGKGKRWCAAHAPGRAADLRMAACGKCGEAGDMEAGVCERCRPPAWQRPAMSKEERVRRLLNARAPGFAHNAAIRGGKRPDAAQRLRPDFAWAQAAHDVYVEVDEHQHSNAQYRADEERMRRIAAARARPAIFIRYNPDAYYPAAWQSSQPAKRREARLVEAVAWASARSPTEWGDDVSALYLFYNGYDTNRPTLVSLAKTAGFDAASTEELRAAAAEELLAAAVAAAAVAEELRAAAVAAAAAAGPRAATAAALGVAAVDEIVNALCAEFPWALTPQAPGAAGGLDIVDVELTALRNWTAGP